MAKTVEKPQDISQVQVKLKPILGIQPGVYLTIIYAIALLMLLFVLLFVPGLRNNGTNYTIESVPSGAAIHVNGFYAGSTPAKVFLEKGEHTITLRRPFFADKERTVATGGRIFGSLFVPKKDVISAKLMIDDLETLFAARLGEISQWALINQFGPSYQLPRLISATVSDYYASHYASAVAFDGAESELLDHFFEAVLSSLNGKVFIADFLRAAMLHEGNGMVPTPDSFARSIHRMLSLFEQRPGLAILATEALEDEALRVYRESGWFAKAIAAYRRKLDLYGSPILPAVTEERMIAGLPFVFVPAGEFVMGMPVSGGTDGEFPHPERTKELYMLKGEVTRGWFSQFIASNPRWAPENKDSLLRAGLVDQWYLFDYNDATSPELPVRYVSYYAAQAFAEWFDHRLTGAFGGYTARLPKESEWEWAARLSSTEGEAAGEVFAEEPSAITGRSGVEHLMGSLWEWCSTWFHPADYFAKSWEPQTESGYGLFDLGAEAVVRGGSFANTRRDRITLTSRGSQPPEWCTEFTGFRIVVVKGGT